MMQTPSGPLRPACARPYAVAAAFALIAAAARAQDVMKVGADTHTLLLDNADVRVLAARIPPGGTVPMHSHPASVIYFLGDARLRITTPDGKSVDRDIKTGVALWNELVTHAIANIGDTAFTEVQVELKRAGAAR